MRRAREIIDGLPEQVRGQVEQYRQSYTRFTDYRTKDEIRVRMGGYALGLMHAGLLTEFERRVVFLYMTVADVNRG